MSKNVLFIGAGLQQSFAIKTAKEMGYFVIAVDRDPEAHGFAFCDAYYTIDFLHVGECLRIAKEHSVDAVLSVGSEPGAVTASIIAAELKLPGTRPEVYQRTRDKFLVASVLKSHGLREFRTLCYVTRKTDTTSLSIQYPVMVKPIDGCGSKGVSRADNEQELRQASTLAMDCSAVHKAEIETFVEGQEYGVECFVTAGKVHVLTIMQKHMTPPPLYAELGHMTPVSPEEAPVSSINDNVRRAIEAIGIDSGSVNVDLIVDSHNQIHIIDLGARMGGNVIGSHIVPLSTGVDLNKAAIESAIGEIPNLSPRFSRVVVTRILDMKPGRVRHMSGCRLISEAENVLDLCLSVKPGSLIRPYRTNPDACGYLVVTGHTKEDARAYTEHLKAKLQACFIMEDTGSSGVEMN